KEIPELLDFYSAGKIKKKIEWVLPATILGLTALLFFSAIRASLFSDIEEETRIWFDLLFLLFAAILAEFIVLYLRQPTVMALMLVGAIISPSFVSFFWPTMAQTVNSILSLFPLNLRIPFSIPHVVAPEGVVEVVAQLGALILLFKVGLESEISSVFNKKNLLVGLGGVILPFFVGFLYAEMTGHSFSYSMFLGAALTATSVGITVALLAEYGMLKEEFAKIIIGAAVIDDILGLLVLSIVTNFPSTLSIETISPLGGVLFSALIFVVGGIYLGRILVAKFIDLTIGDENVLPKKTYLSVMVFFLLYAYVAEFIGLSGIVGTFLAGIILGNSKIVKHIHSFILPLELLFVPIFFISLGLLIDFSGISDLLIPILLISSIAIITKIAGCTIPSLMLGLKGIDSLLVGIGMSPRGEIALIIALMGLSAGILTQKEYTIIASMSFLTAFLTPPIIKMALSKRRRER
ncbi:MAG: cation:proton antiporter, partial [Candidatus Anstonellales archaeon]